MKTLPADTSLTAAMQLSIVCAVRVSFHNWPNSLSSTLTAVSCGKTYSKSNQASVFMTPGDRVAQLYHQALGTNFSRLLWHAWVTVGLFFNPGHYAGKKPIIAIDIVVYVIMFHLHAKLHGNILILFPKTSL
jgi:hypothetical protein